MPPDPVDRKIDRFLSPRVQQIIRDVIEEYDGAEILFVGRTGPSGVIEDAEAQAFGNQQAVPVIESRTRPGEVVIHNHPGGSLEPSQADIEVASRLGNQGIGTYIVDNDVQRLRVIVPASPPRERHALDPTQLEEVLLPDGPIARSMQRYEHRPEQIEMLRTIIDAFNNDGIAAIEAGTGTGKSLAYLLPAIHWAKANEEKVVISTNTINLQEQLIAKDVPFLQRHLSLEFQAELMKGRGNYLCRRRAEYLQTTPDLFDEDEQTTGQIQAILEWAAKTADGSLSEIPFVPDMEVWERVSCDPDNCARIRCNHYGRCFFFEARRRAARADIIIANHHLVMADLALRLETGNYTSAAVLPPYRRIIFDEAHNIEDVATQYFGFGLTRRVLGRLLNRLVHREYPRRGLLPFLRDRIVLLNYEDPTGDFERAVPLLEETIIPLRMQVADAVNALFDAAGRGALETLAAAASGGPGASRDTQLRITPDVEESRFWEYDLRKAIDDSVTPIRRLAAAIRELVTALKGLPEDMREELLNPIGELRAIGGRLAGRADEMRHFYTISENRCRWIEAQPAAGRNAAAPPVRVRLMSLPLEVRGDLNRAVYGHAPTVAMTSATLSVNRRFDFFLDRVGLGSEVAAPDTRERVEVLQLSTPFDYDRQAFVGVPIDIPDPRERNFTQAAVEFLLPALQTSRGSAFLLFTSYRQLDDMYKWLSPLLRPLGYSCLRQGDENRQALLQRFRNDRTSILFATSSFWEGVDVPGDALKLLVLAKLPFRVPTDPLVQARIEKMEADGVDSFSEYSVPQAVIRFKQGFGRLIRTRDDYGAVLILDHRVVSKRYGQVFLNSLPARTIHREPSEVLLDSLLRFFDKQEGSGARR